jgi:hypothetical protein
VVAPDTIVNLEESLKYVLEEEYTCTLCFELLIIETKYENNRLACESEVPYFLVAANRYALL